MKIAVFSDTHVPPQTDLRFTDYVSTLDRMIEGMVERGVDLVLFGGDVAKNHHVPQGVINAFGERLRPLSKAGIPVLGLVGNHDMPKTPGLPHALSCLNWLPNFMAIDAPFIWMYPNPTMKLLQVVCLPYPNRNILLADDEFKDLGVDQANQVMHDMLVTMLQAMAARLDPTVPSILLAHLSLTTAKVGAQNSFMIGRDVCLSPADIPENIDYAFFGHIHKPQVIAMPCTGSKADVRGTPSSLAWVIGSPECVDFGEEGEQKRWILLDTEGDTFDSMMQSIPTGCREYLTLNVDAREGAKHDAFTGKIVDSMVRVRIQLRKGQQFDFGAVRKQLLEAGACSVQIEPQYEDDTRLVLPDQVEGETHEDLMRAYCVQKGISGPAQEELVTAGLDALREVASA